MKKEDSVLWWFLDAIISVTKDHQFPNDNEGKETIGNEVIWKRNDEG